MGAGIETLVPRVENTSLLWKPKRTQGKKTGAVFATLTLLPETFSLYISVLFIFFNEEAAGCKIFENSALTFLSHPFFPLPQEWTEPNSFNVCITSYKQLFKGHTAFMKMRWKYLIVDEMQQIKNMTEKHWEALFSLRRYRAEN